MSISDDADDGEQTVNPLDMADDLQGVGGYPYLIARRIDDEDFVSGTVVRKFILRDKERDISAFTLSFPDAAFLIYSLSDCLRIDADLMSTMGNFKILMNEDGFGRLSKYIDDSISSLTAAKDLLAKVPHRS